MPQKSKCLTELTETEDKTLRRLSVNYKHCDIRTHAVDVMLRARKTTLNEIAATFGVSRQSVCNMGHAWHGYGLCGLLVGMTGVVEKFCRA